MYSKNKVPLISNLSDVQLKLFDFVDFENPVCENSKFDLDYSVKRNENEVYEYNQGFCKHGYSRNVIKQGYNPKMIIADEPTGNLDNVTEADIMNIFKKLAHEENKCVIIVTHSDRVCEESDKVFKLLISF